MFKLSIMRRTAVAVLAASALLAGCATNSAQNAELGINDPYEDMNRDIHDFNKGADRLILRPTAQAYDAATPEILQFMIGNAINHLEAPRDFVNHLLTGEARAAGRTLVRFVVNSTFGIAGLLDPATDVTLEKEDADFAKTLAVWGVGQGIYYEIPLLGPSTIRHTTGRVVDIAFAPTTYIFAPWSGIGVSVADAIDTRADNAELIDEVLYNSEDSYATVRSAYLQRREAFVNGGIVFENAPSLDE